MKTQALQSKHFHIFFVLILYWSFEAFPASTFLFVYMAVYAGYSFWRFWWLFCLTYTWHKWALYLRCAELLHVMETPYGISHNRAYMKQHCLWWPLLNRTTFFLDALLVIELTLCNTVQTKTQQRYNHVYSNTVKNNFWNKWVFTPENQETFWFTTSVRKDEGTSHGTCEIFPLPVLNQLVRISINALFEALNVMS